MLALQCLSCFRWCRLTIDQEKRSNKASNDGQNSLNDENWQGFVSFLWHTPKTMPGSKLTPSPALTILSITDMYQRQHVSKLGPSAATKYTWPRSTYDWTKSRCQKSRHVKERDPSGHLEAAIPGRNDEHCSWIHLVCQHESISHFEQGVHSHPASKTPRIALSTANVTQFWAKPIPSTAAPHTMMRNGSQTLEPTRRMTMLDGISNKAYPICLFRLVHQQQGPGWFLPIKKTNSEME